ncbi:NAD(P)-dependent dehydrogenase (short-subunit alcohol dehydrogenase family) [Raoultella sp. BIGb0138]|uniref:SDR family NAD(P)-dependent oxidoreductase n=1 Tax=Raoultella sp. BIGb0138 TaxID=2485115 RepID=UPI0010521980|nr:SDR family oxidoreductase [Raoultella sp. BIGb0138]TCW18122.1 NAD(P)-dependent dehydrogenase (short-subunit alcohol dehydrogenase family) [Raoultella sp. BIGb0138]
MNKKLAGKVALITGGSRGLGAAIAGALADQGADIAITYVASAEKALAVVEKLRAKGVRAIAIGADQGDPSVAESLVREVVEKLGKLDILVNNAAVAWQGKTIDAPDIDNGAMDRQWLINTMGVIANIRAAVKVLPDGGRIISIGSGLGTRIAFPGTTDYAASKAAIVGYSKGAARDLGARNITVNVVQAGIMDTDMAAGSKDNLPPAVMASHAIQRYASVEEVAATIVFLAGPEAGFITGSVIDVNGGFTA